MKKILLTLLLLSSVPVFSQALIVDTATYSVPQLVNTVLINSPCTMATNISWRTGTAYGSSNGLGFFTNTNPNFPMQGGVIMSTGNATSVAGPNTTHLNDGAANWAGDADLEATLAQAGIPMISTNATVLEFDFMPISSNFNFEFVFASEEYGNFQCQFSDAFAFLLTNMATGETTNLAVVPNTNTPISVVTIRDFLYNSSCPSANAQYFDSFNGGSAAATSATNFNGQTVMMNASAVLVPDTPYHIKLVIADRSDLESDSAIFISSNSFNIGQNVLGADLTVANNTAVCAGETYVLSTGLNPANYTFAWTRNGVVIPGASGASINVTQPGTYGVTYSHITNACQAFTDLIVIEFQAAFTAPNANPIYICDTGASSYVFNLAVNTPILSAGSTPVTVTYHASMADAQNNANPLPAMYNSPGNQTVYARITNQNQCYIVKSFELQLTPPPTATAPNTWNKCSNYTSVYFNFSTLNNTVLSGQSSSIYSISYHTSQADADAGSNPVSSTSFASSGQTIYIRVFTTSDPGCYTTASFEITVSPLPPVDALPSVVVCENYVLPALINGEYYTEANGQGTPLFEGDIISETQTVHIFNHPAGNPCSSSTSFQVTVIDPLTLSPGNGNYCGSYTLPPLQYGNYFTQPNGQGTPISAGTVITSTQTIHIHYLSLEAPFCEININFTPTIVNQSSVGTHPDVFDCTAYVLPPLTIGNYYTAANGGGTQLAPGTSITTSQTIYVFAQSGSAPVNCTSQDSFKVVIGFTQPTDISQCTPYTLPSLPMGNYFTGPSGSGNQIAAGTVISTSQTIYIYIPNSDTPDCMANVSFSITISQPPIDSVSDVVACTTYVLPALTNGSYFTGSDGSGSQLSAGHVITASTTLYVFAQSGSSCSNQSSFNVTINQPPAIDSRSDIDICNAYVLTQLSAGNYYTGPNGSGSMLAAGTVITESTTIYIFAETPSLAGCTSENSFEIFIFSVEADAPASVTACDSYVLPELTVGNYYTAPGGPAGGEGTIRFPGDVITTTTTMYVYTESGERINCSDENIFTITINNTPSVPVEPNRFACNSYTLPALTIGNYFTQPNGNGTMLNAGDVLTQSQTLYVYAETATTPNCYDEKSFEVTIFNVDELADVVSCQNYILPSLTTGQYFTGANGTGTQIPAGTAISTSQTMYIYAASPFVPTCYDESSFEITIVPVPVAYAVPSIQTRVCDQDGTNDGITTFDLTTIEATVLGTQTGPEFMIEFFEAVADADLGINAITSTTAQIAYARVTNVLAPDCYALRTVAITVNTLPVPTPVGGIVCYDTFNEVLLSPFVINSGLSGSQHTFQWFDASGQIVGTGANYTTQSPGTYTVIARRTSTGCFSEPVSVDVIPSEPAVISYTVTQNFVDVPVITVIAEGTGDYEYQLDNGNFQDSNIFENVASGMHTITVRDKNGCGISTSTAMVVNYPHYFTPNGDGVHDTWNIIDLRTQTESTIKIYDRYGKFLQQITPSGAGWDGTYAGAMMPSTDYWFVVTYVEDGAEKEFRAHFAMKR